MTINGYFFLEKESLAGSDRIGETDRLLPRVGKTIYIVGDVTVNTEIHRRRDIPSIYTPLFFFRLEHDASEVMRS